MPATHSRRPYAARLVPGLLLAGTGLLLSACGGGSGDSDRSSDSTSRSSSQSSSGSSGDASPQSGQTISVRVEGDTVTPENERIQVEAGEPLTVDVESDRDGELHVHSSPETTFDFGPGTSSKTFTIARPGIVEMEEHDSDTLVAQLEAR